MRKTLSILFVLILSCSLMAQIRTGNIYGKIVDEEGIPLPGVMVTLTGAKTASLTSITSAEGIYRFLSLSPATDYVIRAELEGFNTEIREGVIVVVGVNVELNLTMSIGRIEEEVTVVAVSPVVDTKRTAVGVNVTQEILQGLPSARDPWVVLQMAPSVLSDRENIGGVESGQQATYIARGYDTYDDNVWAMDGIVITDPAAIGASPSYYDFDAFEEMTVTVGGADVTVQTGGVALNMVTRRGGNKVSLGGRFYYTDEKFQADNLTQELLDEGVLGINAINNIKDYGFNLGGPIVKDKVWLWGSYGVQDIHTITMFGSPDDTLLVNYAAKLNVQIIPENRFEAFAHIGGKNKWGRSSSASFPGGFYQGGRYHFGSPIFKLQDEHMFGDDLFISVKFAFFDAGFNLTPMDDRNFEHMAWWDVTNAIREGPTGEVGHWRYYVERPVKQFNFLLNYFNDTLLGASHDIKVGFEYADRTAYTEWAYPGNIHHLRFNYNTPTIDNTGDGVPDIIPEMMAIELGRGSFEDNAVEAWAAYFSDTISFGRFNVLLGLRYDYQTPKVKAIDILAVDEGNPVWGTDRFSAAATTAIDSAIPAVSVPDTPATFADGSKFSWQSISPRLGLTWDATGDGKTIVKLSGAMYGSYMGVGEAGNWMPGGTSGWMDFWWVDNLPAYGGNGNGIVELNELYWHDPVDFSIYRVFNDAGAYQGSTEAAGHMYGGFTPGTAVLTDPYLRWDPDMKAHRTMEAMLTVEREIFTDFAVTVNATYRRYDRYDWEQYDWYSDQILYGDDVYYLVEYRDDYLAVDGTSGIESQDWYVSGGTPPSSITEDSDTWDGSFGEGADHEYYYHDVNYDAYTPYEWNTNRPDYYRDYMGIDVIFNKRLSNKWMLTASLTWQSQKTHIGDQGYMNPTQVWALDGHPYAAYIGSASGKIDMYAFSRWLVKIGGLYQLPYDFNVGFMFLAREGWISRDCVVINDYTIPNTLDQTKMIWLSPFGTERLPSYGNLTLRVEKMVRLGETGRIYLMADVFNVFNSATMVQRYQMYHGEYNINPAPAPATFSAYANDNLPYQILNPRVVRFGVRFSF